LVLAIPQLMMGLGQDGQLDEALVDARDRRLGVSWQSYVARAW
jgi:hypothetical protein